MTAAIHKNWKAICALTDVYLKIFLTLCRDADVLRKVAMGFPELFQEEASLPVFPLSLIKATAEAWKGCDGVPWNDYLEQQVGIPITLCLHPEHELMRDPKHADNSIAMPDAISQDYDTLFAQCVGSPFGKEGLPWVQVSVVIGGQSYYIVWINHGDSSGKNKDFYVVPCACIDLNS